MYIVVSKWQITPGADEEWKARGLAVRQALRKVPGITVLEHFYTHDGAVAIVGYQDEATYHRIVDDPNGPFVKAIDEHKLEEVSHWVWSERGESVPDPD
jgi:hypothetical protein